MVTSPTTLCLRRVLQRAKLACRRSTNAMHAQRGNSFAFLNESVSKWWNRKGIQLAYFRYDSVI